MARSGLGLGLGLGSSASSGSGNEMLYFFYGTLQHPERLRTVLGLDPNDPVPESRPARVRRYRTGLWGQYPALVRSDQFSSITTADGDEPATPATDDSADSADWARSRDFDIVPGHVVRLNVDKHEGQIQQYETDNYMPQFVEVEVLRTGPTAGPPARPIRRKRPSAVRFDLSALAASAERAEPEPDPDVDSADQTGEGHTPNREDDSAGEWEQTYAKTFVWVGDLSLLHQGRWSLGRWAQSQSQLRRPGLRFW